MFFFLFYRNQVLRHHQQVVNKENIDNNNNNNNNPNHHHHVDRELLRHLSEWLFINLLECLVMKFRHRIINFQVLLPHQIHMLIKSQPKFNSEYQYFNSSLVIFLSNNSIAHYYNLPFSFFFFYHSLYIVIIMYPFVVQLKVLRRMNLFFFCSCLNARQSLCVYESGCLYIE